MGWTKQQLITKAFGAIGLASYVFDLSQEQLQDALSSLDAMMASWNELGIRLGYPIAATPDTSKLDDDSNLKDSANRAVYLNLAIELASGVGRAVPQTTLMLAKQAYNALLVRPTQPPEMQLPRDVPAGAGNRWRGLNNRPFLDTPTENLEAGPDADLDIEIE